MNYKQRNLLFLVCILRWPTITCIIIITSVEEVLEVVLQELILVVVYTCSKAVLMMNMVLVVVVVEVVMVVAARCLLTSQARSPDVKNLGSILIWPCSGQLHVIRIYLYNFVIFQYWEKNSIYLLERYKKRSYLSHFLFNRNKIRVINIIV